MPGFDPIAQLAQLLDREKDRIVRLWAKRLRAESYEVELPGKDLREPLAPLLVELSRLLKERGEDAIRLWPEWVRAHGARRYDQRFDASDLVREFKALHLVLLHVYGRRNGAIEPELAELLAELIGEAIASTQESYVRVVRTEEVRFREAAVMESVLHQVDVGIMVAELDGTLSFATPPVSRLLGIPVRALVGARAQQLLQPILSQLHARHPEGRPFRVADLPLLRALKERVPVRAVPLLIDRPDGKQLLIELSATPLWEEGPEGEIIGVIQTVTDRTDTARKTEQLMQANEELKRLQSRLLQRTRTQALGQLASGAAHALNNFLNVIRLRITLLRKAFKPEHLDALDRTVRNIGDLVARLQEFSVNRAEEELSDTSFDGAVLEALELTRSELERPDAPIALETHLGAPGKARVDHGFFREIITNLLLAARDRMPKGGKLTVYSSAEEGWLSLRVEDSGPPYAEEDLARLFDPFKGKAQAPQVSLLLGMARNQVHRWGGELECSNCGGESGAAFVLRLPVVKEEEKAAPAPAHVAARPRFQQTRRVLVVDDEPENARMLAEVLTDEGYEVAVAHSGAMALQAWEARRFDAALLDALMPDMSGWELARELRKRSPQTLLAMVTGMDVRGQNRNNLALVDAVFRKPLDVSAVDEFLSRSGAREGAEGPELEVPERKGGEPPASLHS